MKFDTLAVMDILGIVMKLGRTHPIYMYGRFSSSENKVVRFMAFFLPMYGHVLSDSFEIGQCRPYQKYMKTLSFLAWLKAKEGKFR